MDRRHEVKMNDSIITVLGTHRTRFDETLSGFVVHPWTASQEEMWYSATRRATFSTSTYLDDLFPVDWRWSSDGFVARAELKRLRRRTRYCAPAINKRRGLGRRRRTERDVPR